MWWKGFESQGQKTRSVKLYFRRDKKKVQGLKRTKRLTLEGLKIYCREIYDKSQTNERFFIFSLFLGQNTNYELTIFLTEKKEHKYCSEELKLFLKSSDIQLRSTSSNSLYPFPLTNSSLIYNPISSNLIHQVKTSSFRLTYQFYYNYLKSMAHELNMSLTNYMQIKDLLIPKHLAVSQNSRKKQFFKRDFLLESPADVAQEHKIKRLKPIGEIQTIMKHFDAKFHNHKVKPSFFAKPAEKHKHPGSAHSDSEHQLQKKMSYLINLPVIKTIKKEAERYRNIINADQIKERQQRKARIVDNFNEYMEAQLRGNSNLQRKKRLHTLG